MKRTILLVVIVAWLLVPTGTPDDIFTFFLIKTLGLQIYLIVLAVLFLVMIHYKINLKKIHTVIKGVFKK